MKYYVTHYSIYKSEEPHLMPGHKHYAEAKRELLSLLSNKTNEALEEVERLNNLTLKWMNTGEKDI